ncbi:MAG: hypothetical protein HONBIEJF_02028 [Fimbriimonadaceae bacterium]|nr:hypothetical protein [Fimbriimonadaceae bacterium]
MNGLKGLKLAVLAGAIALGAVAQASFLSVFDIKILLDKSANGSTLNVRYSGGKAELAELRVNGISKATRALSSDTDKGETSFDLQGAWLNDGENLIEIVLIDKNGKVLGKQKSTVDVDRTADGPVYISSPKNGATVQGAIEIKLGFASAMSNIYASFFMNGDFKSIRNYPPYAYMWDTTRVDNGWHELSATIVDQSGATVKTNPVRVFVNNPGGRTERPVNPNANLPKTTNPVSPTVTPSTIHLNPTPSPIKGSTGKASGIKTTNPGGGAAVGSKLNPANPAVSGAALVAPLVANTGRSVGTKAMVPGTGVNMTGKLMTPSGNRQTAVKPPVAAGNAKPTKATLPPVDGTAAINLKPIEPPVKATPKLISIEPGVRIPEFSKLTVMWNSALVAMDVAPRVMGGIPIAPFRHLFEENGGKVEWVHDIKQVRAFDTSTEVIFTIGASEAAVNGKKLGFEVSPFIERGRTMVPLSFIKQALNVDVKVDQKTGHVLITADKK